MSDTPAPAETAPATSAKKKGRGKLLPLLIGVLCLGTGGGGAYWYFVARPAAAAAPAVEEKPEPTGVVTFEPFVVNLADPGGSRFLRVNIALVVPDEDAATHLTENAVVKSRIRSSILELLAQQTSDVLVTPDGKAALKKTILTHVAQDAHDAEVSDVLFTEFVVQF